jgi:hypothetical protein
MLFWRWLNRAFAQLHFVTDTKGIEKKFISVYMAHSDSVLFDSLYNADYVKRISDGSKIGIIITKLKIPNRPEFEGKTLIT